LEEGTHLLDFDGMTQSVALVGCTNLLELFPKVFQGWHYSSRDTASTLPVITLRKQNNTYSLEAAWLKHSIYSNNSIDIVCAFIAELSQAYIRCNPHQLCLHAAAAEFSGRLVVFPNKYRTGKSLLSSCLAARGTRIFSDDVLPIDMDNGLGHAPGFQPRLRLPLPRDLSSRILKFLHDHRGPENDHYTYLNFSEKELAPKGLKLPIGAFVVLERSIGVKAQLCAIPADLVLRDVIWQNFARGADSANILQRLSSMVARAQCYRLTYTHAEAAAAVLESYFTSWPSCEEQLVASMSSVVGTTSSAKVKMPPIGCYMRQPQVHEVKLNGSRFLVNSKGDAIYYLNPVGSSVWKLLEDPMSLDEMTRVLYSAFPETEQEQIRADVAGLVNNLIERQLLCRSA